ncbi:MAG: hypothetical protein IKX23_03160 [Treponema sp.]|nr:hypothetical protein [Treponema sp.]
MKRRSIYVFITAALAVLIPAPGRFVYGMTLVLEILFILLFGTLMNNLIRKLKLESMEKFLTLLFVVSGTILFRQIMILLQPEVVLNLGFMLYVAPVSLFTIGYLFAYPEYTLGSKMKFVFLHIITYTVFALCIFLIRDILGYGTFTFFGPEHQIMEIVIFPAEKVRLLSFLASIPGCFILCSCMLFIHVTFRYKYNIYRSAEVLESEDDKKTAKKKNKNEDNKEEDKE